MAVRWVAHYRQTGCVFCTAVADGRLALILRRRGTAHKLRYRRPAVLAHGIHAHGLAKRAHATLAMFDHFVVIFEAKNLGRQCHVIVGFGGTGLVTHKRISIRLHPCLQLILVPSGKAESADPLIGRPATSAVQARCISSGQARRSNELNGMRQSTLAPLS